nr:glycine zipper 2TM domain-containing protein [uncultured Sphingosinicella sp.]
MFKKITLSAAAAVAAMTALPATAEARHNNGYYSNSHYDNGYRQAYRGDRYYGRNQYSNRNQYRRCSGTTGTVVGGAAGALAGRAIAGRGNRTTGTILGVAAGALLGRQVGKSTCRNSRY